MITVIASCKAAKQSRREDSILFSLSTFFLLSSFLFLLTSCSTPKTESAITVYSTTAAQPWLTELFACANERSLILNVTADNPEIFIRIGEPENLTSPAYQIDMEELLIVTHRESSIQSLTLEEAQMLFAQNDPSTQLWGYTSDADMQIAFDQSVMQGRSVSSYLRIAANPQIMSDTLNAESNSVGILGRHWLTGNAREVFSAGEFPVLALTKTEPQGAIRDLLTCLKRN